MYTLVYSMFFFLKKWDKKRHMLGKRRLNVSQRLSDYCEWFFNVPVVNGIRIILILKRVSQRQKESSELLYRLQLTQNVSGQSGLRSKRCFAKL